MRRVLLVVGAVVVVAGAVALSGQDAPLGWFRFEKEARNPVTHFNFPLEPNDFQFAIVSDRTGGHRANVFSQAVEKLNLLQPEFVVSVGDLIEGSRSVDQLKKEWQEFDRFTDRLTVPFFYVSGNHDVGTPESLKLWKEKLGRRYYHFIYRGVLFLVLDTDDPPGGTGSIAREQAAWARTTLQENEKVRWTIVLLHRPLWTAGNIDKNGWGEVEKALAGRPYTVFCGHVHRYQKFVRNGQNYYQLATTGGSSMLRGIENGEFDHITWVTVKKDGPILANVMLDAIHAENLQKPATDEPGRKVVRKPTHPVRGQAFFEGVPAVGAQVLLQPSAKDGIRALGVVEADGSFTLSTYTAQDGAAAGEYTAVLTWREKDAKGKLGANQLPAKYATPTTSPLRVTIQAGVNEVNLELKKAP